jgi:FMN phosphatase YigB (HAD superfamily)
MTKTIIFDMWGTIIENGVFPSPVRQIKNMLRINMQFSEYIVQFEDIFMLREFENLTEAFNEVCKSFSINPPPFVLDRCIGLWNKNSILAKPFPETFEVLGKLKGNKLILVSNTDQFSSEQVIKKFELEKYFAEVILSYKYGKLKTNPDFFETLVSDLNLEKEDVLVIGDSIESDMQPAERAGLKCVLVDRREKREYPNKIKNLNEIDAFL